MHPEEVILNALNKSYTDEDIIQYIENEKDIIIDRHAIEEVVKKVQITKNTANIFITIEMVEGSIEYILEPEED